MVCIDLEKPYCSPIAFFLIDAISSFYLLLTTSSRIQPSSQDGGSATGLNGRQLGVLLLNQEAPAVEINARSRDIAGLIRGQEEHKVGSLNRLGKSS